MCKERERDGVYSLEENVRQLGPGLHVHIVLVHQSTPSPPSLINMGSAISKVPMSSAQLFVEDLDSSDSDDIGLPSPEERSLIATFLETIGDLSTGNRPPVQSSVNQSVTDTGATKRARPGPPSCQCGKSDKSSRNLVVCIDGTANQFGIKVRMLVKRYRHS
jgi:hypothetical protein